MVAPADGYRERLSGLTPLVTLVTLVTLPSRSPVVGYPTHRRRRMRDPSTVWSVRPVSAQY
ncbi:hypothetical protein GCM10010123_02540 [Pilimelia anulata]|uniref:Uncharacterized protein n=1 Tax=Pilimelia anulata TaxID=53371 RepID=A0A8J3AYX7_9ACTN|nr:hypothetical protein GCM10010123_02540 [Pilimelia anulata]